MVDEEGKKDEDKVEFDSAGQVIGYLSLEQARVPVLRHARENTDLYGRRYAGRELVWEYPALTPQCNRLGWPHHGHIARS